MREFFDQAWFVTRVSLLPACAITVPFGAVLALQIGSLFNQLGARSFTGAVAVVGIVQQAAPIATVVIVAGAAGTAVAADLGSRKIREELDALEVLGISVIHRLVVPRVLAMAVVACLLNARHHRRRHHGRLRVQRRRPGWLARRLRPLLHRAGPAARTSTSASSRRSIFGLLAGIVATYQGVRAKGGPAGVGNGVNQSVIVSFVLLFVANAVLTAVYYQLVPPKGL